MPQKQNPETVIQNQIRDLLRMDGWFVIRHQQGMGCHKGLSDPVSYTHLTLPTIA